MITVITYGTFDLFHYGHMRLLERARDLGDYLIVGVTSDSFDRNRGKFDVQQSLMERIESVRKSGLADEIIVEEYEGQKIKDIKERNVDIFTVGSDWMGEFDYLSEYCDVIYLDRTEGVSSTNLRAESRNVLLGFVGEGRVLSKFYNESRYISGFSVSSVFSDDMVDVDDSVLRVDSYEELLDSCDAVVIASDSWDHYSQVKKALVLGKHVICQSPIALCEDQARELFQIAYENNLILWGSIKKAYTIAYSKLLLFAKMGKIGDILSIDVTCSLLMVNKDNSFCRWGDFISWVSIALLPIFHLLKTDYKFKHLSLLCSDDSSFNLFSKIDLEYDGAVASIKVGDGVKSKNNLIISGTRGYIYVPDPWWEADYFELIYEDFNNNKKYFYPIEDDVIRQELLFFIKSIQNKNDNSDSGSSYLEDNISVAVCKIVEEINKLIIKLDK